VFQIMSNGATICTHHTTISR